MNVCKHKVNGKPSEAWYFRFTFNKQRYFGSTGCTNKTEALKVAHRKYQEAIEVTAGQSAVVSLTIAQAFEKMLSAKKRAPMIVELTYRLKKLLGTKIDNRTHKPVAVFGFDGTRNFESLSTKDIQQLVLARREEGSSDGTILTELSALRQTIKLVKKLEHPVPDIDFAELKKDNAVKPASGRLVYLSLTQERDLLAQLHPDTEIRGISMESDKVEMRQDSWDLTVLLIDTGARYNEIAQIKKDAIDLKRGEIHIYRSKVKNESVLTMTNRVRTILERRIEAMKPGQKYVFENTDGGARNYCPRAFKSACKRAGIEGITIHSLRHTWASRAAQAGLSLGEIQQQLGHTTIQMSMRYAHLMPNQASKKAAEIMNRLQAPD